MAKEMKTPCMLAALCLVVTNGVNSFVYCGNAVGTNQKLIGILKVECYQDLLL